MLRNQNSAFAQNPTVDINRSKFNINNKLVTSFNVGQLVPIYAEMAMPGDTFKMKTNYLLRMPTLISPLMDDLYIDTFWFAVPRRLVWNHFKEFMGENSESAWIPTTEYTMPQVEAPEGGWNVGTLADYFGIPTGKSGFTVDASWFRAYASIVNEFFRDQNLQDPVNIPLGDATIVGSNGSNYITDLVKGGEPFVAGKFHDYYTSCLPSSQKGPAVSIGTITAGDLPVYGNGISLGLTTENKLFSAVGASQGFLPRTGPFGQPVNTQNSSGDSATGLRSFGVPTKDQLGNDLSKSGLIADGSNLTGSITVNALRYAFQLQKFYERDARGGTRYQELILSHFGVKSPDARLQRPEYLGGTSQRVNVMQVIQSSASTDSSPQGNPSAYSVTASSHNDFVKSFTEHCLVIGLAVVRYKHTYSQGLERMFSIKDRFDFYWPVFANIGEQPVYNKEIYLQGNEQDDEVFGYQEAWADYRYKPGKATGYMNPAAHLGLSSWSLADVYNQLPVLSNEWIQEDKNNVDRIIAVTSQNTHQFFGDFQFELEAVRPMPVHSVPGLIDHN
ncbi:major capsid protein [Capybara microvirus Cap1_SP_141]|nr:major capsid protein [Capybara microvirus Cap1_SP_141]